MNVSNDLQGMQQLFSTQESSRVDSGKTQSSTAHDAGPAQTDEATLSPAASLAARTASDSDVRMEKVNQVQQALAAGTYNVPASEVAGKMIERMLGK
jgi:negative regulator of flagellin synthesis FlgM